MAWSFSAMRLDGKVVLLCGAGGLGTAIARGLAEAGAHLAIADVNPEGARALAGELRDAGHRAMEIELDVTLPEECCRAARDALALGPLYGAVNCSGINVRRPAVEVQEADWDRFIASTPSPPPSYSRRSPPAF